ncbi:XapX domain-containing protein [Streptomyces sp. 7R007]
MNRSPARPFTAFLRPAALSFAAGLLMGAVYWALDIRSPAPPLLGLTGLLGIVLGERAASAVRSRRVGRAKPSSPAPSAAAPRPVSPHEDLCHDRTD